METAINPGPTYWADVLESVLSVCCQSLKDTPMGMPTNCYVGHSRPADDCCDHLIVWVEQMRPTVQFPNEFAGPDQCHDVRAMMDVVVTLRRPCWPTIVDNARNPFPEPSAIDTAATSLLIDIQTMWAAAQQAYDAGSLWFTPHAPDYIKWGHIRPMQNEGGCAGWEMRFTLDLDACA